MTTMAKKKESDGEEEVVVVRIFMDGVFDLMHYGHMNAFRLAREQFLSPTAAAERPYPIERTGIWSTGAFGIN